MGGIEAKTKLYEEAKKESCEAVLSKLWKKYDKKPVCGVLPRKEVYKFLSACYDLIEKEQKLLGAHEAEKEPTLKQWYRYLDPVPHGCVSWEEIRIAFSGQDPTIKQLKEENKLLQQQVLKFKNESLTLQDEVEALKAANSIAQTQMATEKRKQHYKQKKQMRSKATKQELQQQAPSEDPNSEPPKITVDESSSSEDTTMESEDHEDQNLNIEKPKQPNSTSPPSTAENSGKSLKKSKKKEGLSDDLVKDIIYGMNEVFEHRKKEYDSNSVDYEITPQDYSDSKQLQLHRISTQLLKFKDCAPKVFQKIRAAFGVTVEDLLKSFEFDNLIQVKGEGKSGAFLLISKDHRFILKTATMEERDYLWQILPYYLVYVKTNRETLLTRILCVFSMKHEGIGGVTRFFIMGNVFNSNIYYDPIEKFDLKGSTSGRFVPVKLRGKISTLKDQDMLDSDRHIYVPSSIYHHLISQLKKDSEFLAKYDIMDYSLLVGIHYETEANKDEISKRTLANAARPISDQSNTFYPSLFQKVHGGIVGYNTVAKRKEIYYIGIIDILMQYTARKKAEHFFRAMGGGGDELSTVPPGQYQQRFVDFMTMNAIVEINDDLVPENPYDVESRARAKAQRKNSKIIADGESDDEGISRKALSQKSKISEIKKDREKEKEKERDDKRAPSFLLSPRFRKGDRDERGEKKDEKH